MINEALKLLQSKRECGSIIPMYIVKYSHGSFYIYIYI
jgi:hypothetical protein